MLAKYYSTPRQQSDGERGMPNNFKGEIRRSPLGRTTLERGEFTEANRALGNQQRRAVNGRGAPEEVALPHSESRALQERTGY